MTEPMAFENWKAIFLGNPESEQQIRELNNAVNDEAKWQHVLQENYEFYLNHFYNRPGDHKITSTGKSE